jgi:hypothetical protein
MQEVTPSASFSLSDQLDRTFMPGGAAIGALGLTQKNISLPRGILLVRCPFSKSRGLGSFFV